MRLTDLSQWVFTSFGKLLGQGNTWREEAVAMDPLDPMKWDELEHRMMRYRLMYALYDGSAYSDRHLWSQDYRQARNLYRWIRPVLSPAARIIEFQAENLQGGPLDYKAGDGKGVPSALPILTENEAIRPAIARLWRDSNWDKNRIIYGRKGSICGDVGLYIVDDPIRGKVGLQIKDASTVKWLDMDHYGNVQAFKIEELRYDPLWDPRTSPNPVRVVYTEVCYKDGQTVRFATYRDGQPFDWRQAQYGPDEEPIGPEWEVPYGFVPFCWASHIDTGFLSGAGELQLGFGKMQEADEVGSNVTDQTRKLLNGPWLINQPRPKRKKTAPAQDTDGSGTETASQAADEGTVGATVTARGDLAIMWIDNKDVRAQHMVGNMDLAGAIKHYQNIEDHLERMYPELSADPAVGNGETSGRTLKFARQKAENKVYSRRENYDSALRRAHMMAISIGAMRGYEGYEDFTAESYANGDLEHQIGKRGVFSLGKLDDLEEQLAFWNAAQVATNSGCPLVVFLERNGWSDAEIQDVEKALAEAPPRAPGANPKEMSILPPTGPDNQPIDGKPKTLLNGSAAIAKADAGA